MKTPLPRPVKLLVLAASLAALSGSVRAAEKSDTPPAKAAAPAVNTRTNTIAALALGRLSKFDPDVPGARDPFYPDAPKFSAATAVETKEQSVTAFSQLFLRGIVSGHSAIINNRNFVIGEEGRVTLKDGRTVRIKVSEVTDTTVTLTISGDPEPRQLKVRGADR